MKKVGIVGSGLGGLISGALLAKKGIEVSVFEQHSKAGGSATSFSRKGFKCEVGLHEMDSAFGEGSKKKIFDALGVYDNLEFVRVPEFFNFKSDNLEILVPDDIQKAKDELIKKFPHEVDGILKYFELIANISREFSQIVRAPKWKFLFFPFTFPNIFKYRTKDTYSSLKEFIKDETLILVLNSNVGYYHDRIDELSFLYHALGQYSYFKDGAWFIKGGSHNLSKYLVNVIEENSGKVNLRSEVIKLSNNNSKHQITFRNKEGEFTEEFDYIISNASPMTTHRLYGDVVESQMKVGVSLLTTYIGVEGNMKEMYGEKPYSTFFYDVVDNIQKYNNSLNSDINDRGFVFVDYSQIDSGLNSEDKTFAVCCTIDYLKDWENLEKEEYQDKKDKLAESYLSRLEKEYPGIRDKVKFIEVGTAKTMKRYLRTEEGTAYGFAPLSNQFFRNPKVKSNSYKGLFYTGAWVIGGGFSPSINSGGMAYKSLMKEIEK